MHRFFVENARWISAGFLLLFASSVGQTFFIALSGGEVRRAYGLSNGEYGTLFMAATLTSALALVQLGRLVDHVSAGRVVALIFPMLALGAVGFALSFDLLTLFLGLFVLRLFGQGMMVHTAYTLLGRWFSAERGRAVSLAALGLNAGKAILPLGLLALSNALGWRQAWLAAAAALVLVMLPIAAVLARVERSPGTASGGGRKGSARDWTRAEVLRDPLFYWLLLGMMPPAFISNTIFFHQVHLAEIRGWGLDTFALGFTLYAVVTVFSTLVAGQLVDRFSALQILPTYLLPFGLACLALGTVEAPWAVLAFMALYGIADGLSLILFGSLWPEVYGTRHLGSIRAVLIATMVFLSAVGPGLSGVLIDAGLAFPVQVVAMGVYCVLICLALHGVSKRVAARMALPA
ncbi:MFS transporter [Microvirga pudoricolor]|uniref:MFS transporter n=1 Tax=Microvirga pudoricolor TaxID=2778729 RepID=UPI0019511A72|nr:MFS transporter [Microvirga pudoricolor]MBM6594252.1 MFS transporter [Microvirga pudoricolor]